MVMTEETLISTFKYIITLFGLAIFIYPSPLLAQTEATSTGPDLNGTWERQESSTASEWNFSLSQSGSEVTATFRPIGNCERWGFDAEFALEFRGTIEDNVITGETSICKPSSHKVILLPIELTVSDDGNALSGTWLDTDGAAKSIIYIRVGDQLDASVNIETDKQTYRPTDTITISGEIVGIPEGGERDVFIEILSPDNTQYQSSWIPVNQEGIFSHELTIPDALNGTYTAVGTYGDNSGQSVSKQAFFTFDAQDPIVPPPVITGVSAGAAAAAGGGIYLFKKGYLKPGHGLKPTDQPGPHEEDTPNSTTMFIQFECGLLNDKSEYGNVINTRLIGDIHETQQKFANVLDIILEKRKKITKIKEIKEFYEWCKKAREDPDKLLSKISTDTVNKFLECTRPYFTNALLKGISIETELNITPQQGRTRRSRSTVNFKLQPLEAYIEIALYFDNVKTTSTLLIFLFDTSVKVKNITVNYAKAINKEEVETMTVGTNSSRVGKKVDLQELSVEINILLTKLIVASLEKPIEPPIELGKKEFQIRNLSFLS
jgi:hypothetical protein